MPAVEADASSAKPDIASPVTGGSFLIQKYTRYLARIIATSLRFKARTLDQRSITRPRTRSRVDPIVMEIDPSKDECAP